MTTLAGTREQWLEGLSRELYGAVPLARPVRFRREALADAGAERLVLDIDGFSVDAALWMPANARGVIVALDFLGPAGSMLSSAFPLDADAIVALPAWRGGGHGPLDETLRGTALHRMPAALIAEAGWGLMTSCYGSWAPDDPQHWRRSGLSPLLGGDTPAISLWAWALSRMVDVAEQLSHRRIAVAGHSRLGKAALWAAANDTRIAAVLSNNSGCAGASLESHKGGETLADLRARFPHWLVPKTTGHFDQHHLLAAVAPRGVYVASAELDDWADPTGEYLALRAAAPAWGESLPAAEMHAGYRLIAGKLGWHLRAGGHEILPHDWRLFLDFLNGSIP